MSEIKVGHLLKEGGGYRDAIHVAVAPVVAGEDLKPGWHVGFIKKGIVGPDAPILIGIVDPFLRILVQKGDTFWLFLYPNTVKDLRHAWEHPEFPEEVKTITIIKEIEIIKEVEKIVEEDLCCY